MLTSCGVTPVCTVSLLLNRVCHQPRRSDSGPLDTVTSPCPDSRPLAGSLRAPPEVYSAPYPVQDLLDVYFRRQKIC